MRHDLDKVEDQLTQRRHIVLRVPVGVLGRQNGVVGSLANGEDLELRLFDNMRVLENNVKWT